MPAEGAEKAHVVIRTDSSPASAKFANALKQDLAAHGASAEVTTNLEAGQLESASVVVLDGTEFKPILSGELTALEAFARRGGGFVALNGAIAAGDSARLKPLLGGAWEAESRKFTSRMMLYVAPQQHVIVKGASSFDIDDDTIYNLDLDTNVNVLASAFTPKTSGARRQNRNRAEGSNQPARANIYDLQPQMWAYEAPVRNGDRGHRAFVLLQGAPATREHTSH